MSFFNILAFTVPGTVFARRAPEQRHNCGVTKKREMLKRSANYRIAIWLSVAHDRNDIALS
jgi:hypothetical protein